MFPDENSHSAQLFERAKAVLPGGNTRSSLSTSPYPIYAASGEGWRLTDIDGADYVDCVNNMSANIHGHRHPAIMDAVAQQMSRLVSAAFPTEAEVELAELMTRRVASIERIRFTNSGTEALMFAVRAARAFTGRRKVAKIEGGYHGSWDALDVSNRPAPAQWGDPDAPATVRESLGLTDGAVGDTVVLPANRVEATRAIIRRHGRDLAALVMDPLVSRMGFLPLTAEYLAMVREETAQLGILLIFDEVFSFRLGPQGAQGEVGVRPDLSTFGKILGGGFPIGALGGRADVMEMFSQLPAGKPRVDHSGTFNANPISMTAGKAALDLLDDAAFARLARLGDQLRDGLDGLARELGLPARAQGRGSLAALLPHDEPMTDYRSLVAALGRSPIAPRWHEFHRRMAGLGVLIVSPGGFILSTPMDESVIDRILETSRTALKAFRDAEAVAA